MTDVLIWASAYLAAGIFYVARDMTEPRFNQPGYLRTAGGGWRVRLLWPFMSGIMLSSMIRHNSSRLIWKYLRKEIGPTVAIFVSAGLLGDYLFSN